MANDTNLSQTLYEQLGSERLLEELTKAMAQDEYDECMKYIARMYDIEIREDEIPTEDDMEDMYDTFMREEERQAARELWS